MPAFEESELSLLAEGKTKQIFAISSQPENVLIRAKKQLTAFNAKRKNELEGKDLIANQTTCNVFLYLQHIGLKTHFVSQVSETEMITSKCEMIPIEWVARRVATGSFLKRNPGVPQGFRFAQPKIETFYKDDANDDPQWSDEQIFSANFKFNGTNLGRSEIALMKRMTGTIFRVLEKAWQTQNCTLVDMKIEFGVTSSGEIVLADVIDNDSWRVWPAGDKRLQLDKQFYRDMSEVTVEALQQLISNYEKVMSLTEQFRVSTTEAPRALIIMGSSSDKVHCEKIAEGCRNYGVAPHLRVSSAHKSTVETLEIVSEFEDDAVDTVVVAVAGRSNGLGPVIAGNCCLPVINCPPGEGTFATSDIWSSLRMPSGIGCSTVIGPDEAALTVAKIVANQNHLVYGKVLVEQLNNCIKIYKADKEMYGKNV